MSDTLFAAHNNVVRAVLRCLSAEHSEPSADASAESEDAFEQLALAARELARAVQRMPAELRPVGW